MSLTKQLLTTVFGVLLLQWDSMKPCGHGLCIPAIKKAKVLLDKNSHGSCALSLLFLSDGNPSDGQIDNPGHPDNEQIVKLIGKMELLFGRRLNMTFISMAGPKSNFKTLKLMADEANACGSIASFNQSQMHVNSLSQIVASSVSSSLLSKMALTSLQTGKGRVVRSDVKRERLDADDESIVPDCKCWKIFHVTDLENCVKGACTWNPIGDDFAQVVDPRCRECFSDVADPDYNNLEWNNGSICEGCLGCFFCGECLASDPCERHVNQECLNLATKRRSGFPVKRKCPLSFGVAWKKRAFGEGAERLAFKFRYIDSEGNFFGPKMVAKESRFVEDEEGPDYLQSSQHAYHKTFMRTQAAASKYAKLFNEALKRKAPSYHAGDLVEMRFLDPAIFELEDSFNECSYNVLVEPLVEGRWAKFAANCSDLRLEAKQSGALPIGSGVNLASAGKLLDRDKADLVARDESLDAIVKKVAKMTMNRLRRHQLGQRESKPLLSCLSWSMTRNASTPSLISLTKRARAISWSLTCKEL